MIYATVVIIITRDFEDDKR